MKLHKFDDFTETATVGDLVDELLKLDQSKFIFTEGCDCIGTVASIRLEEDGSILIERNHSIVKQ